VTLKKAWYAIFVVAILVFDILFAYSMHFAFSEDGVWRMYETVTFFAVLLFLGLIEVALLVFSLLPKLLKKTRNSEGNP